MGYVREANKSENDECLGLMLDAALEETEIFRNTDFINAEINPKIFMKSIFRAIAACQRARDVYCAGKDHARIYADEMHIVATAVTVGPSFVGMSDPHPYAAGAIPALLFAKAAIAMEAMSSVMSSFEDDLMFFGEDYAEELLTLPPVAK